MADLSNDIETAATDPASASADGESVQARPLSELIEADKYLKANTGASKAHRGLRITKLVPPGTQ